MFCPKCGSIMMPKKENGKTILKCSCGYSNEGDLKIKETIEHDNREIEVVEKDESVHSVTDATCPKCKNDKAYFWSQQMRAGDEPETNFFKCTKCNHTWRDGR